MMFIQLHTPSYTQFLSMVLTHIFRCGLYFLGISVQVLSPKFDSDSSGTLFYILYCGESSCSEDMMSDVGFMKLFTFDN